MRTGTGTGRMREALQWASFAMCAVLAAAAALYRIRTYDAMFHLAAGRLILREGTVPAADPFSFSARGAPWINHSWGFEAVLAWLHQLGGFEALSVYQAAMAAALVLVAVASCARLGAAGAASAALIMTAPALASREVLEARPHVVGFLGLALYLWIQLDAVRTRRPLLLLWLAPVYAVWACAHGSHLLALALTPAALAVLALPAREPGRRELLAVFALAACGLLALDLWLAPRSLLQGTEHMASGFLEGSVSEWYPVVPGELLAYWPGRIYLAVLGLTAAGIARVHLPLAQPPQAGAGALHAASLAGRTRLLLLVVLIGLSFTARRMIPLLLLGGAPLWLPYAASAADWLVAAASRAARLPRRALAIAAAATGWLIAWGVLLAVPGPFRFGIGLDHARFPEAAVAAMRESGRIERVYNAYNYGGYLMLQGVPEGGVLVDGRAITVYPGELLAAHLRAYEDPRVFERLVAEHDVDGVLLPVQSARAARLRAYLDQSPNWRVTHRDAIAIVFEPAASAR